MTPPSLWQREEISYPSGHDRCAGWLYKPKQGAGRLPAIVLGHGFGGVREMLAPYAEVFAAAGMIALAIDYRSFGASSGEPRQVVRIDDQLQDLTGAFDFLADHAQVDPSRLGMWGSSLGGGHAISMAARDSRIRAAVAQVPHVSGTGAYRAMGLWHALRLTPATIADLLGRTLRRPRRYLPLIGNPGDLAVMTKDATAAYHAYSIKLKPELRIDAAAASMLAIARYSPAQVIAKVRCPLLMIVAERDATAPASAAIAAAAKAPNCELLRYPSQHFDVYLPGAFEEIAKVQAAFFQRHLGVSHSSQKDGSPSLAQR